MHRFAHKHWKEPMKGKVTFLNPEGLHQNPAFLMEMEAVAVVPEGE